MHPAAILEPPDAPGVADDSQFADGMLTVRLRPKKRMTRKDLEEFCADNSELRIEQNARGELIIMAPAFSESGEHEATVVTDLSIWAREYGGRVYNSNSGFTLRSGAMRAPDASWISSKRHEGVPKREWKRFAKVCPDFVVEIRSPSDRLPLLQEKMVEYLESGARLGWLIDPLKQQVFIYRAGKSVEHLQKPTSVSGDPELPGFVLDLTRVW